MEVIEYNESMGKIERENELVAALGSLPFEQQQKLLCIELREVEYEIVYGERIVTKDVTDVVDVSGCEYARAWIVRGGTIVGVAFGMRGQGGQEIAYRFLQQRYGVHLDFATTGIGGVHGDVSCVLKLRQ